MESFHHPLSKLPPFVSRWLGYRIFPSKPVSFYGVVISSFVAAFCGMSVIQATLSAQYFAQRAVPPVIASYGASAVLIYGSIDSPLAQPGALIGGHFIGALFGICITKLFQLLPPQHYIELQWLAGSLSVSFTLIAMQLTRTVHPPAGATALLAVINQQVVELSWYLLPVVLFSSTLALVVALCINNIRRRYPLFWFTPGTSLSTPLPEPSHVHEDDKIDSHVVEVTKIIEREP